MIDKQRTRTRSCEFSQTRDLAVAR